MGQYGLINITSLVHLHILSIMNFLAKMQKNKQYVTKKDRIDRAMKIKRTGCVINVYEF